MHYLILTRSQNFNLPGNLTAPIRNLNIGYTLGINGTALTAWWNRYTLTADDDSDLRATVENLILSERLLVSGGVCINPALVLECDDGKPFDINTRARLLFNHNFEGQIGDRAYGLRGDGQGDEFTVLRTAQNRSLERPYYRSYYAAVADVDIEYQPAKPFQRGALGLRTAGPLGRFYFPAHAAIMGTLPGIDSDASFDRDGNSIGLFPKVGKPVLNVASILNKQKAKRLRMGGDEKLFNYLLYIMLEWAMTTLYYYEKSYEQFNFHWDRERFPMSNGHGLIRSFDHWLDGSPIGSYHWIKPEWLENFALFWWYWRDFARLMGCVVDAEAGPVQVHEPLVPLAANGQLVADILLFFWRWEKWAKDTLPGHFAAVEANKKIVNWEWHYGSEWYDLWPDLESMLFSIVEKICLLNCVAYLSPTRRQRGPGQPRMLLMPPSTHHADPTAPDQITVRVPAFYETQRVGHGPFLQDGNSTAIHIPAWNPTMETPSLLTVMWEVFKLDWMTANAETDAAAIQFHKLKIMWPDADAAGQQEIIRALERACLLIYGGVDPEPDLPPPLFSSLA